MIIWIIILNSNISKKYTEVNNKEFNKKEKINR